MKRTSKTLALFMAVLILGTIVIGCATGDKGKKSLGSESKVGQKEDVAPKDEADPEEKIKVRYVVPGSDSPEQQEVVDAVNKKMVQDGLNLELEIKHIGWDAWFDKTNVMLSTGEEFELLHVMENGPTPTIVYATRGAIVPLDDLIKEHAPGLIELFTDSVWNAAKVNGQIYTIPAYWRDVTQMGGEIGDLMVRKELLDKLGFDIPKTFEELVETGKALKKEMGADIYAWDHAIERTPVWLHRTYDEWPFYVDFTNGLFYVDQNSNVKSWYETDLFKRDCERYRELYKANLIHPDVLSVPKDTRGKEMSEGRFIFGLGTGNIDMEVSLDDKIEGGVDLEQFFLAPEKGKLLFMPLLNSNAVPSTTSHPEAGIKFINWLYSDKENSDLFLYGIEDKHFEAIGDQFFKRVEDENQKPLYFFDFWQIGYYKYQRFEEGTPEEYIRQCTTTDTNILTSPVAGFVFNPEPVQTEYSNVLAQIPTVIYPIKMGVVDYEDHIDNAIKTLKTAGLDKVIEEYERQFKEWQKNNN